METVDSHTVNFLILLDLPTPHTAAALQLDAVHLNVAAP
jgi:hypothetical protein